MSESQVLVTPGKATLIAPQLKAGTTIFNNSVDSAVWVSASPDPVPGTGYRVGGNGSILWQNAGPAMACVDDGVTSPVSLTVSDHVGNPVNPVDVATAVSDQLYAKGIPNVLTGDIIYGGQLPMSAATFGDTCTVPKLFTTPASYMDFTPYASVVLALYIQDACLLTVQWSDVNAGGSIFTSQPYVITNVPSYIYIAQTVKGPNLTLQFSVTQFPNPFLFCYASNRVLADGVTQYDAGYNSTIANRAWTASEQVNFGNPFISKGGKHTIRLSSSFGIAVCKGFFGYRYIDSSGNTLVNFVTSTHAAVAGPNAETEIFTDVMLPPGVLTLLWQNSVTGNTYEIKATITAGG